MFLVNPNRMKPENAHPNSARSNSWLFWVKKKKTLRKKNDVFLFKEHWNGWVFPQERWKGEERFDVDRKELSIQNSKSRRIFFKMEGN